MKRLRDNINSSYAEAANALRGKQARRKIIVYVESYDDIYFWRTVLSRFENNKRYFEVMLPSKTNLSRGKKSVLMNFVTKDDYSSGDDRLGSDMIACVDADFDFLLQGATPQSKKVLECPYIFHTYVYAIENFQCYAPALHDVCVAVTLIDRRIFDFQAYLEQFSQVIFPLFIWNIMGYRYDVHNKFTITEFNRIADPSGFTIHDPQRSLDNIRHKVEVKVRELQREFPEAKEPYLKTKDDIKKLGITPQTTYLYIQGHHLFDTVVSPIMTKVCNYLRQAHEEEINKARAHGTQKRNELSCFENSQQDIKVMLKKSTGYQNCPRFKQVQDDIARFLKNTSPNQAKSTAAQQPSASSPASRERP